MAKVLLEAQHIAKTYGRQTVLDDVSFRVAEGEKIALIGRNGSGKTTLMNILLENTEADGGEIILHASAHIGVVHQHATLPHDVSVQTYLEQLSHKPSWEVKKMAAAFDMGEKELAQMPADLSGGYQMRVKLLAMFLLEPNLLLLDEPVNYLDVQTLILLERVLQEYKGAFVLIAHDRTFLENTCEITCEIERGELTRFNGTVSTYLDWKHEQMAFQQKTNKRLKREIAHAQTFVDRFRYKASLASRAQNKIKHIARLRSKIRAIHNDLASAKMHIPCPPYTKGIALDVQDMTIGYADHAIVSDIHFDINRGEKIVISGENGHGKSTFLKTIAGIIPPIAGSYKWWKHAEIGYYDQQTTSNFKNSETVLAYLTRMAPKDTSAQQILMMAGNFLFHGDDLDKSTSVLSGGERARLALAGILLGSHTVLILDEPTNHLDVETTEVFARALQAYEGTVFVVSHARTFVHAFAERIFDIRFGRMQEFIGNYEEYIDELEARMEIAQQSIVEEKDDAGIDRALLHSQVRGLQRDQERLQKEIDALEKEKSKILKFFFENPTDYAPEKATRLTEINEHIPALEEEWIAAQEKIDSIRAQLHEN